MEIRVEITDQGVERSLGEAVLPSPDPMACISL